VVLAGGPVDEEHAAGAANRLWGLGNQLFGEVEIEVGYEQIYVNFSGEIVVRCVVKRGGDVVFCTVTFDDEKYANFFNFFFGGC
jgi:hypothetical protein